MPLADLITPQRTWPDGLDATALVLFCLVAFGIPALGYVFMVLDFRAYLRSLQRAMVVAQHYLRDLPAWVKRDNPRCLTALNLTLPCTPEQVLTAYRIKVKQLHPDRGGDRRQFLLLQQHFEQAMQIAHGELDPHNADVGEESPL